MMILLKKNTLKLLLIISTICILILTGCSFTKNTIVNVDEYEVENIVAEVAEGDFIFRLMTEKEQYKESEPISLIGEIIYVGEQDEIEIIHSSSAVLFNIHEEVRGYDLGDAVNDIGVTTVLTQNEPYRESYQ